MMRGQSITESQRPATPLMNYEASRFDWRDSLPKLAIVIGAFLVAALAGTLVSLIAPRTSWEWQEASIARQVWIWFGLAVLGTCGIVAISGVVLLVRGWWETESRRARSFEQDLEARQLSGGLEIERTASAWELDAAIPLHMLALVVGLHFQIQDRRQQAPWAVRNMTGPLMIGGSRSMIKLLEVTEHEAREAGQTLAQLGLVHGRGDKSAGQWVPETLEEAVRLLADNWRKVG